MNLTCPSCGATFRVDAAQLGPAGRRVRCGDCSHTWRQKAAGEKPAPAPEPAADPAAEQAAAKSAAEPFAPSEPYAGRAKAAESAGPGEVAEPAKPAKSAKSAKSARALIPEAEEPGSGERVSRRAFSKPSRPPPKQPRGSLAVGWAIYAVVVIGLGSGFYFGRAPLVAMVPEMTRLYDLVGLKDEVIELGLQLRDVKSVRRLVDDERVVVIEGLIVNLSSQDRQVPPLRVSVIDAEGVELDRWNFLAESASLAPGGTTRFETVGKNPPREGNLSIEFVGEK